MRRMTRAAAVELEWARTAHYTAGVVIVQREFGLNPHADPAALPSIAVNVPTRGAPRGVTHPNPPVDELTRAQADHWLVASYAGVAAEAVYLHHEHGVPELRARRRAGRARRDNDKARIARLANWAGLDRLEAEHQARHVISIRWNQVERVAADLLDHHHPADENPTEENQ